MKKLLGLVLLLTLAACTPASLPQATSVIQVTGTPGATSTAVPTDIPTLVPMASPTPTTTSTPPSTATPTYSPSATATRTARPAAASPTSGAANPGAPAARPAANTATGHIPSVGSGAFSVDENASGPWNCIGLDRSGPAAPVWMGDFYIGVRGGPGDYTISEPENCHWDPGEQRFICRYGAEINLQVMRTLYVSCPGCTKQPVALVGRGVMHRADGPSTCLVQQLLARTPTPSPAQIACAADPRLGPLYPQSPVLPWDREAFIKALGASRDSVRDFVPYFAELVAGKMGDCGFYSWKYYSKWEAQPGFKGVPDQWYKQYLRYRTILDTLRTGTYPITQVCLDGGGHIPEDIDKTITAAANNSLQELEALYAEALAKK